MEIQYEPYYNDTDYDISTCIYTEKYMDDQGNNKYLRIQIDDSPYPNYSDDELLHQTEDCLSETGYGESMDTKIKKIHGIKIARGTGGFTYNVLDKKLVALFYVENQHKFIISSDLTWPDFDKILNSLYCACED
ncbi:MAG: hypothetical protein EHM34_06855 [Nitrosopumilales archaeon]|nr:MAG: hypothetical protein EHM34_06855 [Nitrosopumilales archaeon]